MEGPPSSLLTTNTAAPSSPSVAGGMAAPSPAQLSSSSVSPRSPRNAAPSGSGVTVTATNTGTTPTTATNTPTTNTTRNPILRALLDPNSSITSTSTQKHVSESCMDLLLMEMVHVVMKTTRKRKLREKKAVRRLMRGVNLGGVGGGTPPQDGTMVGDNNADADDTDLDGGDGDGDDTDADDDTDLMDNDDDDDNDDQQQQQQQLWEDSTGGGGNKGNDWLDSSFAGTTTGAGAGTGPGTAAPGPGAGPGMGPAKSAAAARMEANVVDKETVFFRLEAMGYAVGQSVVERYVRSGGWVVVVVVVVVGKVSISPSPCLSVPLSPCLGYHPPTVVLARSSLTHTHPPTHTTPFPRPSSDTPRIDRASGTRWRL